ncbi:adenosylcobinamide-GDP ribazoletransferase [Thalassospira sp. MA62]|nr:adenosylcobinamide-GDP ribazoletransferase [Thalassospira sp. MA62]
MSDHHNQNETNKQSTGFDANSLRDPATGATGLINDFWRSMCLLGRVPVVGVSDFSPAAIARSVWCWPLVGLFIAGLAVLPALILNGLIANDALFVVIVIATMVVLTGALHEDGLADCADGFGGGLERAQKLEIMRDSRIGTYGVVALVLGFALRAVVLYAACDFGQGAVMFLIMAITSRSAMPIVMWRLAPARNNGLGKGAGRPALMPVLIGCAIAFVLVVILGGLIAAVMSLIAMILGAACVGFVAQKQIGGQTGDVLGATQIAAELCAGIGFLVALTHF